MSRFILFVNEFSHAFRNGFSSRKDIIFIIFCCIKNEVSYTELIFCYEHNVPYYK